jgi:hypothetical protein
MTRFTQVLGGVASLALAGALAAGGPAFAQSLSESSPQEMAQTMMLNAQEAEQGSMLVASNDAAQVSNQNAYKEAQMQFDQAQARYKQQVDDYNKELNDYQTSNQTFERQANEFVTATADYDAAVNTPPPVVVENPPPVVIARRPDYVVDDPFYQRSTIYPDTTLVRLGSLPAPDVDIAGAPVEDRLGRAVGHFKHMTYFDEGKEEAVIVLNNSKMIALSEDHFRFDTDHSVVVADLSFDELNRFQARF